MRKLRYLLAASAVIALTYACSSDDDSGTSNTDVVDPACVGQTDPPDTLACTGLYAVKSTDTLATDVRPYAPAVPLWSDGAEKTRWIKLPAGTKIDATDPAEWKFPVGTKAWKEFRKDGKRVETRLWQKVDTTWVNATYAWNADGTAATISKGGDVTLPSGSTYHIPTNAECQQCHRGRSDRLLGFEGPSLGQDGATGWTLADLVSEDRISPAPTNTHLSIGDDGTGQAAPALAWIHVNCGVTCHNTNSSSIGYAAGMNFRLDPTLLDGRSSADFGTRKTTLGVTVVTPQWAGATRIVPGSPDDSLLVQLISRRADNDQMPPIATSVVDDADVAKVRAWIAAMGSPPTQPVDAGVDASPDTDAGVDDAGVDAASSDAGTDSGTMPDAGTDAETDQDGGALCTTGSIAEMEPNGSVATENTLPNKTSSFCGRIPSAADTDYVTFTIPAGTTSFGITYATKNGSVQIDGAIDDGTTFKLDGTNPPVKVGHVYTLKVTSPAAAAEVDYAISISVTP